ncbi:MAG: tetratricopeptide repeat protein [Rubripirellula sp.]|jgi:cytochrome c-type biogenesis protein CcmH/NrfG
MSSATEGTSPPSTTPSQTGHGEGGRWKQVRFEELSTVPMDDVRAEEPKTTVKSTSVPHPKVRLERRQQLEHHLKSSPTDLDGFMELGRIYRADDRPLEAKRIFEQARQIFPEDQELLWEYEEAVLARSLQQYREVSDLAVRLDTLETERELKRSQHDWARRRIEVCRARLTRNPSLHQLKVAMAEAMYDAEMYEDAIATLEPVLDQDTLSPRAYLIKGRCLLASGNHLQAMVALRAVALRRAVVAPLKTRIVALKLLCETAEKVGVTLTLAKYQQHLSQAEGELAQNIAASK